MNTFNKYVFAAFFSLLCLSGIAHKYPGGIEPPNDHMNNNSASSALKAADCNAAITTEIMNFNNVRSLIETGGSLWQNRATGSASYFVPADQNVAVLYAGALWMGGKSPDNQLKLAAVIFRNTGDDFWPGPLNQNTADIAPEVCAAYDQMFISLRSDAQQHRSYYDALEAGIVDELFPDGYDIPEYFDKFPAMGNEAIGQSTYLAPFFDYDGDGDYDPTQGDYPWYNFNNEVDCKSIGREDAVPLFGDQTYYWIFNDKGGVHTESGGDPIGMEIRAQAFSFAESNEVNDMTFYNYTLINQGTQTLTQTYFGQYADADVGTADNDYVGCDVARGLGYAYNGADTDPSSGSSPGWGDNPPAVGIDFFEGPYQDNDGKDNPLTEDIQIALDSAGIPYPGLGLGYGDGIVDNERFGMRKFIYYNIGGADNGDPETAADYYNYMTGFWKNGAELKYGGDGFNTNIGINCDYMFPGDTDPLAWGTHGEEVPEWSEVGEANNDGDRRFIQSAGPFTLEPGQFNNITVGVVYGRSLSGSSFESVRKVFAADDKAQTLFDNCFEVVPGPDAPELSIREMENKLILTLTNTTSISNNTDETEYNNRFRGFDPGIPAELNGTELDSIQRSYRFQGYKIYQLSDQSVSPSDLEDDSKARLIFQSDIKDDVLQVVNNVVDFSFTSPTVVPHIMADGLDEGIEHSYIVTEDKFALGNKVLVNHKTYYFMAIAYAYNNYLDYVPAVGESLAEGQPIQYLASRKSAFGGSIKPIAGIPHTVAQEAGGTTTSAEFGDGVIITQHEGAGNGTNYLDISITTENNILDSGSVNSLEYLPGKGPVNIKVIDPIRLQNVDFSLKLLPYEDDEEDYLEDSTFWQLIDLTNNDTIMAFRAFKENHEYILADYGISLEFERYEYTNAELNSSTNGKYTGFLSGEIVYKDPTKPWYVGVPDEEQNSELNWIRLGNYESSEDDDVSEYYNDVKFGDYYLDEDGIYESILGGTWAPAYCTAKTDIDLAQGTEAGAETRTASIGPRVDGNYWSPLPSATDIAWVVGLNNVDIVFTNDQSKWTRSPVLEMQIDPDYTSTGNGEKMRLRDHKSVDKRGFTSDHGWYNAEEGDLTSPMGMGWFPGYAIDIGTGERLNIAFGEDSWLTGDNGNDMIWNPSSTLTGALGNVRAGGQHWIYVFKNARSEQGEEIPDVGDRYKFVPGYDEGAFMHDILVNFDVTSGDSAVGTADKKNFWSACTWIGSGLVNPDYPLLSATDGLIPNEARVKLRVAKKYKRFSSLYNDFNETTFSGNDWNPSYTFTTRGIEATTGNSEVLKEELDKIQVVPNPYYAYSEYETSKLDNRVKLTNLPEECTITIYNVSGTLIRQFVKADPLTSLDWDLKNAKNIPIASGVYIIHIKVPDVGERILKWFGVMRPVDLDNF